MQAVFPSDNITTTLYTAVPAAIIGFLLLFSNTAVGEYAIICAPLKKFINDRTDFRFIASYCWVSEHRWSLRVLMKIFCHQHPKIVTIIVI